MRRIEAAMQRDQHVDRHFVKRALVLAFRQEPREGAVAEIFDQQQPGLFFGGEDRRRAEIERAQMARDGEIGPHIFLRRRRIHQHRRGGAAREAAIAPEGSIAGKRRALGIGPAASREERRDLRVALSHVSARRSVPSRRATAKAS